MQLWWVLFFACCPCWTGAASGDSAQKATALRGARAVNGSHKSGMTVTSLFVASKPTTTRGSGLPQASIHDPSCSCGKFGCACDVLKATDLTNFLLHLGFDQCVDEGLCEACSTEEMQAPPCKTHGKRQRMSCAKCGSMQKPTAPSACRPSHVASWSAVNGSSWSAVNTRSTTVAANASKEGLSIGTVLRSGIFFRSCLAPLKSNRSNGGSGGSNNSTSTAAQAPTSRPAPSERSDVLMFLALNGIVLTLSGNSLRKQQAKRLELTLIGEQTPSRPSGRGTGDSGAVPEKIGRSSVACERASPGRGSRDSGIMSEKSGRSTLAEAATRAGTAIELAVTGSEHKTK